VAEAAATAAGATAIAAAVASATTAPPAPAFGGAAGPAAAPVAGHWHLSLRFGPDVLRSGMDPCSIFSYLGTLGDILHVETVLDKLPRLAEFDPEECYLGFELAFRSSASRAEIEGAFEFVRDEGRLHFLPPGSPLSAFEDLLAEVADGELALAGERLVLCGSLRWEELELLQQRRAGTLQAAAGAEKPHEAAPVAPPAAGAAAVAAGQPRSRGGATLRVDAEKMDHHINLVGELVVASAGARLAAQRGEAAAMREAAATLSQLVEAVRDSALNLRMVPIGATFERFQRVVRDTSRELGKEIELALHGGETELDKTVVERIGDPLTHLVRNAMDHGIETAELRRARGKPAAGKLLLNAYHDAGNIVIEVADDGGGLDRGKILRKARERGLVAADAELADHEIDRLIFEPGFSTADAVSQLSGRGVGMDVVRSNIEALRGSVSVASEPGQGSTVRIRLPLTLAIIDGFLVGVGDNAYVIPLELVDECIELGSEHQGAAEGCLNLRGEVLPFRRLREQFAVDGAAARRESVVVVRHGERKAGFVVDRLMGEFQTVIKPLGKVFGGLSGVTGFTILGGGDIALILDVSGLIQQMERNSK
jgi:two-component system, chemotaxis family, sensor kinase CheA